MSGIFSCHELCQCSVHPMTMTTQQCMSISHKAETSLSSFSVYICGGNCGPDGLLTGQAKGVPEY